MRIRINLLPHRQIKRAELQKQFLLAAGMAVLLGVAIIVLGYSYINANISTQNSRNARLQEANTKLEADIKEIEGLKEKISELKERIKAVESLQDNRSVAVSMLDEIARRLPEAVSLSTLKQTSDLVTLHGQADTNARVAELIANLSTSTILMNPQLIEVSSMQLDKSRKVSIFTITTKLKLAVSDAEKSDNKAKGKKGKAS